MSPPSGDPLDDFVVGASSSGVIYFSHDTEECDWHTYLAGSWRFIHELYALAHKHLAEQHPEEEPTNK